MLSYERSAVSVARAEDVWACWVDVASWCEGEIIDSAHIDGDFQVGAVIKSKAKGFPTSTLTVTEVQPPRRWVDESRFPGMRMTFEHVIEPRPNGTAITERVLISGLLGQLVGRAMRGKLESLFAASTAQVARRAEEATERPGERADEGLSK